MGIDKMDRPKRVLVIGTGYVGLPAAIMLANAGHDVVGVDIDEKKVEGINAGKIHIIEEDLQEIAADVVKMGKLRAQTEPCGADIFIIAVPTPLDRRSKVADLSYVRDAMSSIIPHLSKGNLIILESTCPPLTCRDVVLPMLDENGIKDDIMLAYCPERIIPGNTHYEIVNLDRVIGGINERSAEAARDVYASFVKGSLFLTDDLTAELCKLMENTSRDVNVAMANEFSSVGEALGVDINKAIEFANKHPRVDILKPGIGVGGHCLPIDPWFMAQVDPEDCTLIYTARRINDERPTKIAAKIRRSLRDIESPKIVALGVTYKPDSDDLRESPAIEIISLLEGDGYNVNTYDPLLKEYAYGSIEEIAEGSDCLVILVEHKKIMDEYLSREKEIKKRMRTPLVMRF